MEARVVREPDGFSVLGSEIVPLADSTATSGTFELLELRIGAEGHSPLHTLGTDKVFFVLEGEVQVTLDLDDVSVAAGAVVHVPAGTPHRYVNRSGRPARMLVATAGAGHVAFLRGMHTLTADGPPDPHALATHAVTHHVRILAPNAR